MEAARRTLQSVDGSAERFHNGLRYKVRTVLELVTTRLQLAGILEPI